MKILNLSLFFAVAFHQSVLSSDFNLNEICAGILFQAIAHPYDRNLFIGCVQGRGTIFGCENVSDVFDPETTSCVDPNILTTTEWISTSTEEPTTTTEVPTTTSTTSTTTTTTEPPTTTTTEPPTTTSTEPITTSSSQGPSPTPPPCEGGVNVQFVCPLDGTHTFIPSSTNCVRYFECILGWANVRDCPNNTHFDVLTSTCMSPEQAFCGNRIRCVC